MAIEGKVVQVIGATVDVEFPGGHLPSILNAVHITDPDGLSTIPIDLDDRGGPAPRGEPGPLHLDEAGRRPRRGE